MYCLMIHSAENSSYHVKILSGEDLSGEALK